MSQTLMQPTQAGFTAWVYGRMCVPQTDLPASSVWLTYAYNVAIQLVNQALSCVSPPIYVLAVYNLGGSLLLNFAQDMPGYDWFSCKRADLKLDSFVPGVVASTADVSTSTGLLNPEFLKTITLDDLQRLKDPYGRQYLMFAQIYGSNIWGIS